MSTPGPDGEAEQMLSHWLEAQVQDGESDPQAISLQQYRIAGAVCVINTPCMAVDQTVLSKGPPTVIVFFLFFTVDFFYLLVFFS